MRALYNIWKTLYNFQIHGTSAIDFRSSGFEILYLEGGKPVIFLNWADKWAELL